MNISFFFLVIVLLSIGLVMVFSASYATSLNETGNSLTIVLKQAVFVVAGVAIMVVASFVDYHIYRKFKWAIYFGGLILMCAALLVPQQHWRSPLDIPGSAHICSPRRSRKFALIVLFCAHHGAINYKQMKNLRLRRSALCRHPAASDSRPMLPGAAPFGARCSLRPSAALMMFVGGTRACDGSALGIAGGAAGPLAGALRWSRSSGALRREPASRAG